MPLPARTHRQSGEGRGDKPCGIVASPYYGFGAVSGPCDYCKVQSANGVIHLIVEYLTDLTADLKHVSDLAAPFPLTSGRSDEASTAAAAWTASLVVLDAERQREARSADVR